MTNIIKIEKEKLIKIVELARNNRGINIDDLLLLASVDLESEKEVKKEVEYEQDEIKLDVPRKVKKHTKKSWSTNEENKFIKMVESGVDYEYMVEKLGRTKASLYNKANLLRSAGRLNDKNNEHSNSGKPYSKEDDQMLLEALNRWNEVADIPEVMIQRLSHFTGRSSDAVKTRLYYMKNGDYDYDQR